MGRTHTYSAHAHESSQTSVRSDLCHGGGKPLCCGGGKRATYAHLLSTRAHIQHTDTHGCIEATYRRTCRHNQGSDKHAPV
jgi:hypothetical protein